MNEKQDMLDSVYIHVKRYGKIKSLDKIIKAMSIIDRKFFVPKSIVSVAYADTALPIGYGQTISQPSTVATMLLLAELKRGLDVLEVGAGSGWNASLIQYLVHPGKVIAIERISSLAVKARKNIEMLEKYLKRNKFEEFIKLKPLKIDIDDALNENSKIWSNSYDRIIITAGIPFDIEIEKTIQKMADSLLKRNGIMLCPEVEGPIRIYKKNTELVLKETIEHYVFVPLIKGRE